MNKTKVKQQRHLLERHSSVNAMSDFFAESNNSFQILEDYFLNFFMLFTV